MQVLGNMKGTSEPLPSSLPTLLSAIWLAALLLLPVWPARAEQYHGNGDAGSGGAIGNGTLTLSDDGTNISGTLTVGGSMNDVLVLYIQTGPGGFADTSGFNDQGDSCRQAISGVSASGRSLLTFASGFQPNYAIALAPAAGGGGGLWQLANGGNNNLVYLTNVNLAPLNSSGPYTFSFPAALIGMIPGVRSTFQVFGTYVRTDGSRSTEAIAGDLTGAEGWNPFNQTAYANYTFDAGAVLVRLPLGVCTQQASSGAPAVRYGHSAVWTGSEMIVWGGYREGTYYADGGRYNPTANSWTALPTSGAPVARHDHTAVWPGSEMIVWGGYREGTYYADGGRYSPTANSWTAVPAVGAPAAREWHTAVWTGSEMIVWGGYNGSPLVYYLKNGGRYNPLTGTWTVVATNGAPSVRAYHTAVWTGSEMIVWGGGNGIYSALNDGGRYSPTTNEWAPIPTNGAPAGRIVHAAVWTGAEMIVWGGEYWSGASYAYCGDGGRYNPLANSWAALLTTAAPGRRYGHTAVWTGSEMIVWGGYGAGTYYADGGRYNPLGNSWTTVMTDGAPVGRYGHTAVWTGSEMIVFGGYSSGRIYVSGTWSYFPYAPAVRISPSDPTTADIAWPVWHPTLRLCQTTNLAAGDWTTVTNVITQVGAENRVTISPLTDGQFFRAVYP
jgi:N-acetylneuraminic acid mutarotase